ncbi:MAG: DUF881 domain-containing protein [Mahellales bacterium]|jgi:uncharacterized protein YlxW (UPF0749 family)
MIDMGRYKGQVIITVVCVLLGFLLTGQYGNLRNTEEIASVNRIENMLQDITQLNIEREKLSERIRSFENTIREYEDTLAENDASIEEIRNQLNKTRLMAGLEDVQGPGIEVIIDDSKGPLEDNVDLNSYLVHDEDLLLVVNALNAAGAEAISINGQRIVATTPIKCGGPTINIAGSRFTPPFVVKAIGDSKALHNMLMDEQEGLYYYLKMWGLEISIKSVDNVEIPRYYGQVEFNYAKPVKEGE